ncbi:hypothetical protein L6452_40770 [Arctium lappa]|uniref:Uncharacterized protein n=1 Tax=Arctium lappa TaxID=4217 RepID=A0ACB8XMA2_ARCLA|nr:hypothetical protein L6452_40770 [Arctium lappa]
MRRGNMRRQSDYREMMLKRDREFEFALGFNLAFKCFVIDKAGRILEANFEEEMKKMIRILQKVGLCSCSYFGWVVGICFDFQVITVVAALKSPYMLVKGWHLLFHDCIGREVPFLESICVPFAGLAILLWLFAVAGALLRSMVASIFLDFYAAVIAYHVNLTIYISISLTFELMVAAMLVLLCTRPPEAAMFEQIPWLLTVPSIAIIGREVNS